MSAERPSLEPISSDAVLGREPRRQHTELGLGIYLLLDSIIGARINPWWVPQVFYILPKNAQNH